RALVELEADGGVAAGEHARLVEDQQADPPGCIARHTEHLIGRGGERLYTAVVKDAAVELVVSVAQRKPFPAALRNHVLRARRPGREQCEQQRGVNSSAFHGRILVLSRGPAQCGEDRARPQDFVLGPRGSYGAVMDGTTTQRLPARPLALPNLLTYARIAAVPAVVACMYWQALLGGGLWLRWVALAIFIAAGITDFLDGYFARIWGQQSTFG